jgi:outer membrane protein assembly factor BamB
MKTLLLAACLWALTQRAPAADWPQFRGPNRDGISKETGLLKTWPSNGPPLLWTCREAGIGFSLPAIVGDRLYTMGAKDKTDHVYALDTQTGRQLWSTPIGPMRVCTEGGDGPCATPTVDGDRLYVLSTLGELVCLETATGKKIWNINLKKDLGGAVLHDGRYTESPLIDGDTLVCSPGGRRGTVAALDKKTGQVIWRSKDLTDEAVSSSSILVEVAGVRQYVNLTGKGVAAVAARDGTLLWRSDIPEAWIMVATPIFSDSRIYVTSSYGRGCGLLKLSPRGEGTQAEEVYRNKVMKNQHSGVILVGEHVYGYSDQVGWVCQEFQTGKSVWEERRKLGKGSLSYADGHFYCYSEDNGTVALIEATAAGWKEKGRFTIPQESKTQRKGGRIWTPPVVAHGRLYLRDQELLFCYDIKDHGAR